MNNYGYVEIKNVTKIYKAKHRTDHDVRAVDGISLCMQKGEVVGLVGESGSGKTTLAKLLIGTLTPTQGSILVDNELVQSIDKKVSHRLTGKVQMVYQDPYSSLNPRMTIGQTLLRPLKIHHICPKSKQRDRIVELLEMVRLRPEFQYRYPHELSGGQRQRIGIARALAVKPSLIILDEPTSALDVSIQAQTLELLNEIHEKYNLTYLFISHNLSVVQHVSNRIAVMFGGRIVEIINDCSRKIIPQHPYTKVLLSSLPVFYGQDESDCPSNVPYEACDADGCIFYGRCYMRTEYCRNHRPEIKLSSDDHQVACFNPIGGGKIK